MEYEELKNNIEEESKNYKGKKSFLFSEEQLKKIRAKTPHEELESYKTYNGQEIELTGVKWPYFKNLLNNIIGVGNWCVDIDATNIRYEKNGDSFSCTVPVRCFIIELLPFNMRFSRPQGYSVLWQYTTIGSAYFNNRALYGDLVKAAQTDGTKKCFSMLGFCDDVYSGDTKIVKNIGKMKPPRSGVSHFTNDEKIKVKEIKTSIQMLIKKAVASVKKKQSINANLLTDEEKSLLLFSKDDLLRMANEILIISVSNNDKNVHFDINESVYSYSDLHSLYEWEIFKSFVEKKFIKFIPTVSSVDDSL